MRKRKGGGGSRHKINKRGREDPAWPPSIPSSHALFLPRGHGGGISVSIGDDFSRSL